VHHVGSFVWSKEHVFRRISMCFMFDMIEIISTEFT